MACRSEVVTDEGAFHKFISIAALHTATEDLACPLTLSPRQATRSQLVRMRDRDELEGLGLTSNRKLSELPDDCQELSQSLEFKPFSNSARPDEEVLGSC